MIKAYVDILPPAKRDFLANNSVNFFFTVKKWFYGFFSRRETEKVKFAFRMSRAVQENIVFALKKSVRKLDGGKTPRGAFYPYLVFLTIFIFYGKK